MCNEHCVVLYVCTCTGSEDLVARTTIVGIIMAFRKLTLEALNSVLSARIPFLLSSITDFKISLPDKSSDVRMYIEYSNPLLMYISLLFPPPLGEVVSPVKRTLRW